MRDWLKKIDWQALGLSVGIVILSCVLLVGLTKISAAIPIAIIVALLSYGMYRDIKRTKEDFHDRHV